MLATLGNVTTSFTPPRDGFLIEIIYKLSICDNITKFDVFNDDQKILYFLANIDIFKDKTINEDKHDKSLQGRAKICDGNPMPKGVVSLENLFDLQIQFKGPPNMKTQISTLSHGHINLGTNKDPKYVNIGTCYSPQKRHVFIQMLKQYWGVFARIYEDIKT